MCMREEGIRGEEREEEESVFQCLILSASLNLFVFRFPQRLILDSVHFRVCRIFQIVW